MWYDKEDYAYESIVRRRAFLLLSEELNDKGKSLEFKELVRELENYLCETSFINELRKKAPKVHKALFDNDRARNRVNVSLRKYKKIVEEEDQKKREAEEEKRRKKEQKHLEAAIKMYSFENVCAAVKKVNPHYCGLVVHGTNIKKIGFEDSIYHAAESLMQFGGTGDWSRIFALQGFLEMIKNERGGDNNRCLGNGFHLCSSEECRDRLIKTLIKNAKKKQEVPEGFESLV